MRGRKPKPATRKKLTGNPGKRALDHEPEPKGSIPVCPKWLPDKARAKWAELAPELCRLGLLTAVDGDTLSGYCLAWSELQSATAELKAGYTVPVGENGGLKAHPAVARQQAALKALRDFGALLGLDPLSRGRLKVPKEDTPRVPSRSRAP